MAHRRRVGSESFRSEPWTPSSRRRRCRCPRLAPDRGRVARGAFARQCDFARRCLADIAALVATGALRRSLPAVDLRARWAAQKSARRSNELSGGGFSPVCEPEAGVPCAMPGLSSFASAGSVGAGPAAPPWRASASPGPSSNASPDRASAFGARRAGRMIWPSPKYGLGRARGKGAAGRRRKGILVSAYRGELPLRSITRLRIATYFRSISC